MSQQQDPIEALKASLDTLIAFERLRIIGDDRILKFNYKDIPIQLHIPLAHIDLIQKEILRTNSFFEAGLLENHVRNIIKPGSIVVDIGANIGNHTVFFSRVCRASQVIAFEPQSECFANLLRNVQLNRLEGVQCFRLGLGAAPGRAAVELYKPWNSGGLTLKEQADGAFEIITLDSLSIPKIDVLKIDVEGFQKQVLEGAVETIKRTRPKIIIEMREGIDDVENTHALLLNIGSTGFQKLTNYERLYSF